MLATPVPPCWHPPGYDADLLVIDGDPLADATTLQRARAVWARGVQVAD
jgi:imidazolonepropionase-like amidohydrolase